MKVFNWSLILISFLLYTPLLFSQEGSEGDKEKTPSSKDLPSFGLLDTTSSSGPLKILRHTCTYADGKSLKEIVESLLSPQGKVVFSEGLDVLVIQDSPKFLETIETTLKELDIPMPLVQVEARIIEITLDDDLEKELSILYEDMGLSSAAIHGGFFTLETPGPTPSTNEGLRLDTRETNSSRRKSLDGFIRYLITENKAKILSSPTLVAGRGKEASLITGEEVPIQTTQNQGGTVSTSTTFKRIGIKLKFTPLKISGDSVKLLVAPEVSSVNSFSGENPIVAIRNTRTTLSVKDGQTLVIGGLHREENSLIEKKIPLLGDIPFLGQLFRSKRDQNVKSMLVFYLKVDILDLGEAPREIEPDISLLENLEDKLEKEIIKRQERKSVEEEPEN